MGERRRTSEAAEWDRKGTGPGRGHKNEPPQLFKVRYL